MNGGLDASAVFPITTGEDIWRKGGGGFGSEAGWLGRDGVGDEEGLEMRKGFASVWKNLGDFLGGFAGEFGGSEAREIENGGGDEVPTGGS